MSSTEPVRVAACQVSLRVGEPGPNRAAAAAAVTEAAASGARIVVLPELTPSGYVFADPAEARSLVGARRRADRRAVARAGGRAHQVVIVGGFSELGADGLLYNSAMLVDPSGVRAVYRKVHLWDAEADFFTPGNQPPPVVGTRYGTISMMICYDVEFPEWVRLAALAGADLLAVPTNWPAEPRPGRGAADGDGERNRGRVRQPDVRRRGLPVRRRARRGLDRAAASSPARTAIRWPGRRAPRRRPAEPRPELLLADCDLRLARNKATGPRNDAHADRRPALYR